MAATATPGPPASVLAQNGGGPHADAAGGHSHGFSLDMSWKELIAGATAGLGEHLAMFPCDTIKTRMQQQEGAAGFRAVAARMLRDEPLRHLYRGCVPVLMSAVPAHGAYFSVYEAMKRALHPQQTAGAAPLELSTAGVIAAAASATLAHDLVSVPFDVVKQRMQVDAAGVYRSSLACARAVIAEGGVGALFVALPTTVAMNVPHVATHWVVYEAIKRRLVARRAAAGRAADLSEAEEETAPDFVIAGLIAGACAATASTPFDNVKTLLQLGLHPTARAAARDIYRVRGARGFLTGVLPRVMYMAPSAAIVMSTYELTKSALAFMD